LLAILVGSASTKTNTVENACFRTAVCKATDWGYCASKNCWKNWWRYTSEQTTWNSFT